MLQAELNDIITRCITKDAMAQERLYKHYFGLMYTICKDYSGDKQTLISLVNEGFLKIFMNLDKFDYTKGHFESWAKKVMINTAIDYVRGQKNKISFTEIDEQHYDTQQVQQLNNHAEEEVLHLIKKLPNVTQKVFRLHIFKGYSHKEIAVLLQMNESTSRWHLAEARKNLKQQARNILSA